MKQIKTILTAGMVFLCTQPVQADLTAVLDTVVVTASRIEQDQYEVAGNLTVITKEDIAASTAQNIPDILRSALGVNVYDSSTVKSSTVDIRGFGDSAARNVLIMIDGRRVNTIDISAPDLVQVPIGAVERIEIIRGAGSVLYGDNAVGGVVNIITKEGEDTIHGRAGFQHGSYDTYAEDVEVYGEKNGLSYFLYGRHYDTDGYRANSAFVSDDVSTKFKYAPSENLTTRFSFGYHDDRQRLPGGLSAAQLASNGRRSTATPNDTSYTTDTNFKFGFDLTPWTNEEYLGDLVVDFTYRDRNVYDEFNQFSNFHTLRRIDTKGMTAKYIFDHTIFDHKVDFVTGVDFYDHENDILGSGSNADKLTISKEEVGIYGFLEYEMLERVHANFGTRYHKAKYTFNQTNAINFETQEPDEWVSMGGLKWEYADGSNLHANVQQSFRFLATDEWYTAANFPGFGITPGLNLDLKQQTGIQYEVGVKHNFNNKVMGTLTTYLMDLDNEVYFDPATFANANYDKTRRIGVEVGTSVDVLSFVPVDILDRLVLDGSFTYQSPEFDEGTNDGKDIPFVPRHQAKLGLTAQFLEHFTFSVDAQYIGSRFAINDNGNNAPKVKGYAITNAKLSYDRDYWSLFAAVNNITDERYFSFLSRSSNLLTYSAAPAPERNFVVGVNVKF